MSDANDIKKAMQAGINAHKRAQEARAELERTVRELDLGLQESTDGRVGVKLASTHRPRPTTRTRMTAALELGSLGALIEPVEDAEELRAFVLVAPAAVEHLCYVDSSPRGYPVDLAYADVKYRATSRSHLMEGFLAMLTHPSVGRKIAGLLEKDPAVPTKPSPGAPKSKSKTKTTKRASKKNT